MLTTIFCEVDDFCNDFEKVWRCHLLDSGTKKRLRDCTMSLSEIMTIEIHFHLSGFRCFKHYYLYYIQPILKKAFPNLVSYNRFVELKKVIAIPLYIFLNTCKLGKVSGISFIDSTAIKVCHNLRIKAHKVFKNSAQRGKTSVGWFYGFKLHLIISDTGDLLGVAFTPGNVDDRDLRVIDQITRHIFGKLFGDKGYISQKLSEMLQGKNIQLITKLRKNMKNKLMDLTDRIYLRKRALIETVIDFLKNICQIEHTRHRSVFNFGVNILAGLVAYTFLEKKPALRFNKNEYKTLELCLI